MLGKPNVRLPLASSYNTRGTEGFTEAFTNQKDQRKINCFYEPIRNSITGSASLYLSKRPGVSTVATGYGPSSGSVQLLAITAPNTGMFAPGAWVFGQSGTTSNWASDSQNTTTFNSNNTYSPRYVGKTLISNVETVKVQLSLPTTASSQIVYYASNIISWTQITHANFTSLVHRGKMESMDGFEFVLDSTNKIFNSSTNTLASWGAADFVTKQITQDYPRGLARLNNQIIAFGDETMEIFYNAGNSSGSPLSPVKQLHQRFGLAAPLSSILGSTSYSAIVGNRIYFVGRRAGGIFSLGVFAYNGSIVEKVSTPAVDKILSEMAPTATRVGFTSLQNVGFFNQQALAINLAIPTQTSPSPRWLMFFPDWNDWFEWQSDIFNPVNSGEFFLSQNTATSITRRDALYAFRNVDANGPVNLFSDAGVAYKMQTQFKVPNDGNQKHNLIKYGVIGDTATTGASPEILEVAFSDDDWQTTTSAGTIDLTQSEKVLTRGGGYYDRGIILTSTTASEVRLREFIGWVT